MWCQFQWHNKKKWTRSSTFIGITLEAQQLDLPDSAQFHAWKGLFRAIVTFSCEAATSGVCSAVDARTTSQQSDYSGLWPRGPPSWLKGPQCLSMYHGRQLPDHTLTWIQWRHGITLHRGEGCGIQMVYSTGVDCFGPFTMKVGCRTEKQRGLTHKC